MHKYIFIQDKIQHCSNLGTNIWEFFNVHFFSKHNLGRLSDVSDKLDKVLCGVYHNRRKCSNTKRMLDAKRTAKSWWSLARNWESRTTQIGSSSDVEFLVDKNSEDDKERSDDETSIKSVKYAADLPCSAVLWSSIFQETKVERFPGPYGPDVLFLDFSF